uniref:Reverse transcriptase domain-containing protein n=1 Tax=Tanacetum cinerariifolium TaxID=118510 RepID=A0A699QGT3_TANCI|nr:hypothetical protein [Tanacetum cinerariifolium]
MEEDGRVPFILGRPFLYTADVVIRVKYIYVIDEILEEYFDALLDECSEILYSIKGMILEEKLFVEFDEFMAMTTDENCESESDTEEPPFEKITTQIVQTKNPISSMPQKRENGSSIWKIL